MLTYQLQQIPCTHIGPPLFAVRLYRDDRELSTSIQNFGILNPPRVMAHDRVFWILDGHARIEASRKTGATHISCLVCDEGFSDLGQTFLHCLELNSWDREFNVAERALCLQQAQKLFTGPTIPKHFWDIVGINEDIRTVHQHKEFLKLPDVIQKYAVVHDIPLQVILNFLRFPPAQIENIAAQLFLLPINRNKLAEILSLLLDVTKREGLMPLDILNAFLKTLEGEKNLFKKEERLRELLSQRRRPEYSRHLQNFQSTIEELSLGDSVQVEPSPFFEDESITLKAKLHSLKDRDELIKKLQNKGWEKMLKMKN